MKPQLAFWPVGSQFTWLACSSAAAQMVPHQGCSQALFPERHVLLDATFTIHDLLRSQHYQLEMAALPDQAALKSQLDALAASSAGQLPLDSGIRNGGGSSNFHSSTIVLI